MVRRYSPEAGVLGIGLGLGIALAAALATGYVMGYAFTKGSQAAGCLQGTCAPTQL